MKQNQESWFLYDLEISNIGLVTSINMGFTAYVTKLRSFG